MDERYYDFDENLIQLSQYEVLGQLQNPFLMENGAIADTPQKWAQRRQEMLKTAVELQYGTQPPAPEFLEVETLYGGKYGGPSSYRIITGTRKKPVDFLMKVIRPKRDTPCPVVIDGDMCFLYHFDRAFLEPFLQNGICFVTFDRTQLAHDIQGEGRGKGQLYETYPEYTFGALGAWAWGYSRCVDALEKIGQDDLSLVAFTGHSRGGKTAMLAGVLDERAKIVNPNSTCAGSCGCYRIHSEIITETGRRSRSETLEDIVNAFPFWFGPELPQYAGREQELPFDSHFLKALVAPRVLLVSEAASDGWANPVGSYMTTIAAAEVYRMLGVPENLYWIFRRGMHEHRVEDICALIRVIRHLRTGEPVGDRFFKTPFCRPEPIFDWHAPEKHA